MNVTPISDWILVHFDPLKKRSEIIDIAGDNDTTAIRTGTVLSTGLGRPLKKGGREPMTVTAGDRVCFFRWHQEHRPGKMVSGALSELSTELGKDVMLIRQSDILFQFTGDMNVDVP